MKLRIRSRLMPRRGWLLAALLLAGSNASAQHRPTYPHPPEPADPRAASSQPQTDLAANMRVSPAQLRQEAQELSSLAQTITQDIDAVNRGVLPKDTVSRLKRVEKLAKQLRQEIGR
jgi:hypothetical protein